MLKRAMVFAITTLVCVSSVYASGAVVKTFTFDELTFRQAGKELFSSEEKTVNFPVELHLIKFNSESYGLFGNYSQADNEKEITIIYRVFPGALTRFVGRNKLQEEWEKIQQGNKQYSFTTVSIHGDGDVAILANNQVLSNQQSTEQERNDAVLVVGRIVFVSQIHFSTKNEYDLVMQWYDAIDEAVRLNKPVVITMTTKPSFTIGGVYAKAAEAYLTSQQQPESTTSVVHSLLVKVHIADINVDR